jgi:hypothetical protein
MTSVKTMHIMANTMKLATAAPARSTSANHDEASFNDCLNRKTLSRSQIEGSSYAW